jgi:hypothetical protein
VRNELSIVLALLFLSLGALLVYEGNGASSDLAQSASIIGGALLLALGLAMPIVMSNRKWKKPSRRYPRFDATPRLTPISARQRQPSRTARPAARFRPTPQSPRRSYPLPKSEFPLQ